MASPTATSHASLPRVVGVFGAVMMGLGSIIGTGVFVTLGIAAGLAGSGVIIALALAALLAAANGLCSAQLAASHPVSGGTYEYGYRYLNAPLGFTAGWMFLCAKSASAATAALGFAAYLLPLLEIGGLPYHRWVGLAAVVVLTVIVLAGARRSNSVNIVVVFTTLATLLFFIAICLPRVIDNSGDVWNLFSPVHRDDQPPRGSGILEATALMFVAYTGYGRIATLGEEVREPRKTIPKAIIIALLVTMSLYVAVAWSAIAAEPGFASGVGAKGAALERVAVETGGKSAGMVLAIGAVTAMLGVLLNLILGLSRVALAMGRRRDLPAVFGRLDASGQTPSSAVLLVALIIGGLVMIGDVKTTWSFSAFTVLVYYAITNLAALRLPREERLYPKWIAVAGLAGCGFLAFWVEPKIWAVGLGVIAVGLIWHALMHRRGVDSRGD